MNSHFVDSRRARMPRELIPIRVLSIDDHPLVQQGIASLINSQSDMHLIAAASRGSEGISKFRELKPDVTLMDLRLPDMSGIEVLRTIKQESAAAPIIIFTTLEGYVEVQRALAAGANGYLFKSMSSEYVINAIRQAHAGRKSLPTEIAMQLTEHLGDEALSARELEILTYVAEGNRNREISERLFISEETVKAHLKHIMGKLDASDRTQAVSIAVRRGYIHL